MSQMGAAGRGGIYRPREEGESVMNTTPAPVPRPTLDTEDGRQSWRDWGSYRAGLFQAARGRLCNRNNVIGRPSRTAFPA
jgi:hypothetical protein